MYLSDLGGAGNDGYNMRPLAHAFVPKGNRLHTVNAVARGFCVWVAEWTTAPQPTVEQPETKLPDVFWRDQIARYGRRAVLSKDLDWWRLSTDPSEAPDAMAPGSRTQS